MANFLDVHAGEGFENITQEDLKIPFLRILQKGSPQLDPESGDRIKGAQAGMFFNTVTEKLYGKEVKVIPILFKKVWLEWKPNRGGLVGRHEPYSINVDQTDFSNWTYNGNVIQESLLFYCLIADHLTEGPIVFALNSTGIKHGKNWNTQITMTRLPSGKKAPYFASVWKLQTVLNQNNQGSWYQIGSNRTAIIRERFIKEEEYTKFIVPMREALAKPIELDFKQIEDTGSKSIGETVPY